MELWSSSGQGEKIILILSLINLGFLNKWFAKFVILCLLLIRIEPHLAHLHFHHTVCAVIVKAYTNFVLGLYCFVILGTEISVCR